MKYGLTLDNSARGSAGDFVTSLGTTVWDASAYTAFHHDIIGIGRDDFSGLTQKQAKSKNDTVRLYILSLKTTNADNAGTFASNESFLVIGHNEGSMCADTDANLETPFAISTRIAREWKVTNTNFNGTFSLDLRMSGCTAPFDINHLRLMVDADGDFSNATVFSSANGIAFAHNAGIVTISGITNAHIPIDSTCFVTLGSSDETTTLPIVLTDFQGEATAEGVRLTWQTSAEVNNAYFLIEQSADGFDWEGLLQVDGANNTSTFQNYEAMDSDPISGISFYRLQQVDIDGAVSYSKVIRIKSDSNHNVALSAYPNPTQGVITIEGVSSNLNSFDIYDVSGQSQHHLLRVEASNDRQVSLDISALEKGLYFIKSNGTSLRIFKL